MKAFYLLSVCGTKWSTSKSYSRLYLFLAYILIGRRFTMSPGILNLFFGSLLDSPSPLSLRFTVFAFLTGWLLGKFTMLKLLPHFALLEFAGIIGQSQNYNYDINNMVMKIIIIIIMILIPDTPNILN